MRFSSLRYGTGGVMRHGTPRRRHGACDDDAQPFKLERVVAL